MLFLLFTFTFWNYSYCKTTYTKGDYNEGGKKTIHYHNIIIIICKALKKNEGNKIRNVKQEREQSHKMLSENQIKFSITTS